MRLFVALLFDEKTKDALMAAEKALAEGSFGGNFTKRENLHLTLAFIGETSRAADVRAAMDSVVLPAFSFGIAGTGEFRREGGSTFWAGINGGTPLAELQRMLSAELRSRGFAIENREFRPHLTLAREFCPKEGFDKNAVAALLPAEPIFAGKISLMQSERVCGRLVYTEIYAKKLNL